METFLKPIGQMSSQISEFQDAWETQQPRKTSEATSGLHTHSLKKITLTFHVIGSSILQLCWVSNHPLP